MNIIRNRRIAAMLLAGASFGAMAPADAARILFSSALPAGPVTPGQPVQTKGGTTQVQLDNGAIVSFVGPANFSVGSDGQMQVTSGATTVIANGVVTIGLPGGLARVQGLGSFTVTGGDVSGRAAAGASMALTSGGQTRQVSSGQSFQFALGSVPAQTFAAPAQAVPSSDAAAPPVQVADSGLQQNPAIPAIPQGTPAQVAAYLTANTGSNLPDSGFVTQIAMLSGPTGAGTVPPVVTPPAVTPPVVTPPVVTNPIVTPPVVTPPVTTTPPTTDTGASTGSGSSGSGGSTGGTGSSGGSGSGGSGSAGGSTTPTVATSSSQGVAILGGGASGGVGGDPGIVTVGFDAAGTAIDFGLYGKTSTATATDIHTGTGWQIGRYASGDFQRTSGGVIANFPPRRQ